MKSNQKPLLTLFGIFGFLAIGFAEEVALPLEPAAAPAVILETPAAVATPAVVPAGAAPVVTPVAGIPPAAIVPTGDALSHEIRNPDGSISTITTYHGQIPQHLLPGFWNPYGLGLGFQRPYPYLL